MSVNVANLCANLGTHFDHPAISSEQNHLIHLQGHPTYTTCESHGFALQITSPNCNEKMNPAVHPDCILNYMSYMSFEFI